jgi:DNA-binding IscR family transcriptional regulator
LVYALSRNPKKIQIKTILYLVEEKQKINVRNSDKKNPSGAKVISTTSAARPLSTVDRRSATGETALAERLLSGFSRVLHRELNTDWHARATWVPRFRQ